MNESLRVLRRWRAAKSRLDALTEERDAAMRERFAAGVSVIQIAEEVGLTRQAVYNVLEGRPDNLVDMPTR